MGFGFVKDEEEKRHKIEHSYRDKLSYFDWKDIAVDMRVQSVITETKGTIVGLTEKWYQVSIVWDNKKESCVEHKYLQNVIVI